MKLIASGVTFSAAIVRSPSFSRSSSSTTMIIWPARNCGDGVFDAGERAGGASWRPVAIVEFMLHQCRTSPVVSGANVRPAISAARTTYLPTMSHSRLTRSRTCARRRFVCAHVNGTICTSNRLGAEPGHRQADAVDRDRALATRGRARAPRDSSTVSQWKSASGRSSSMLPIASTCPCTKWPPNRPSARSGRSRFTSRARREPAERRHAQRLRPDVGVNLPVLGDDDRQADAVDGHAVARRQLRGERRVDAQADAAAVVGLRSTISPTASTRPVNITLYQDIRPERLDVRARRAPAAKTAPRPETARRLAPSTCGVDVDAARSRRRLHPTPRRAGPRRLRAAATRCRRRPSTRQRRSERAGPRPPRSSPPAPPVGVRACARAAPSAVVTIMTGPASGVESTRAPGGVRSRRSKTTRMSGRSR